MLTTELIHPPLLEALASLGHGSRLIIADGNYPLRTASHPAARAVYLNIVPGLLTTNQVLEALSTAVNFESATVMVPDGEAPVHDEYRALLGHDTPFERVDRFEFYEQARAVETGLVIATGDQRLYANLLLTVGLR